MGAFRLLDRVTPAPRGVIKSMEPTAGFLHKGRNAMSIFKEVQRHYAHHGDSVERVRQALEAHGFEQGKVKISELAEFAKTVDRAP